MLRHRTRAALEFKGAAMGVFGEEREVVRNELDADLIVEPVDRRTDVLCVERELGEVVEVVAIGLEVLHHRFDRVIRHAEGLLELGALSDHLAARNGSGAADEGHFLDENDVEAVHACANGGGHAGSAAAHDDDIGVDGFIFRLLFNGERNERRRVRAGLLHRVGYGRADRRRGDGGAGNAVNLRGLTLNDAAREQLSGLGADARGFGVRNLDVGNFILRESDRDCYFAVDARRFGRIGARFKFSGGCADGKYCGNGKREESLLHIEISAVRSWKKVKFKHPPP